MKVKVVNNRDKKPINKEILIILIAVFSVLLLTIGFSAFKETLYINGMFADVRIPADIRVTGISVNGNTSGAISNSENYDVKSIVGNITLPQSDSSITYRVQITNFQGPEMGIFNLTGLPDNLDYELKDYTLKEKICNNDKCSLGVQKEILITIKYK